MSQDTSLSSLNSGQDKDTQSKAPFLSLLKQEAAKVTAEPVFKAPEHDTILNSILKELSAIDFHVEATGGSSEDKVKRYQQIVICIEKIIEKAEQNGWPMCQLNGSVYLFNGAWWQALEANEMQSFLGKAAEKLSLEKHAARYVDTRKKLLEQFTTAAYMKAPRPSRDTVLINLQNGTFEIKNGVHELREPRPEDFLTYQLPFSYNEQADAPLFKTYLDRVQPDASRQAVLAEFLGSVFLPGFKHEKALLLYGGGANGKSVFFEITKALIGEANVSSYSLKSLTGERGANSRAMLENKLLNYASEIGNGIGEIDTFKSLTSGEPVDARRLYQDVYQLTWLGRLIFNCNELPHDTEQTNAFFRRLILVPFDVTIPEAEHDKKLAEKIIKSELAGVFNWLLEGLERLIQQQAFTHSAAIDAQLEKFKRDSCSVRQFIEEKGYQPDLSSRIAWNTIYTEYQGFCIESGLKPVGKTKFSSRLKPLGIETDHDRIGTVVLARKILFV